MPKKQHPKKITLFLIDGQPEGRQACELSNWTGKALKIPKIMVRESADRTELHNPGVYLLFGKSLDEPDRDMVYIGESEMLLERLRQHVGQKEFWNEAVVIFSKDENLNKAHIRYLECRMHELATKAKRCIVENSQAPTLATISEADRAEMEEFFENIQLLVSTMGHKVFTELEEQLEVAKGSIYTIKSSRGANAKGQPTSEGFVVYKGSVATKDMVPSISTWAKKTRKQLIEEKILLPNEDGHYVFQSNYLFQSPSGSATLIQGCPANGRKDWKNNKGVSLGDVESSEV